jgi:hypothetical protein
LFSSGNNLVLKLGFEHKYNAFRNFLIDEVEQYGMTYSYIYWDMAGKGSKDLSIAAYPTNFLVDTNGVIIHKNIGAAELAAFLKDNI